MSTATIQSTKNKIQQKDFSSLTQEEITGLVEMISIFLEQEEEREIERKLANLPEMEISEIEAISIAEAKKEKGIQMTAKEFKNRSK